jgi:glycosyltransferase involved in cell wall biosynthesis
MNINTDNPNKVWPWFPPSAKQFMDRSGETYQWPRISIVTPSFNQGDTIEETILSIINQGYPNLEYIIMDGGSTDKSVEIIKKYEPWLTFWVSETDLGQSHAINKGWQRCTGEIFTWLNSDDYLEDGTLHRVASIYCQVQPNPVGLIYGRANWIDAYRDLLFSVGEPFDLDFCLKNLIDPMPQPSVFISKKSLQMAGFLDENLHYAMDYDLFLRINMAIPPIFINEIWSYARYTPDTKTSRYPLGFVKDYFKILEKIFSCPVNKEKYKKLKGPAYASAYLRSARLHFKTGKIFKIIYDLARALVTSPGFMIKKVIKILIWGRYGEYSKLS